MRLAEAWTPSKNAGYAKRLIARDHDYVAACRMAKQAARRGRQRKQMLICVLALTLAGAGVGWWKHDVLRQVGTVSKAYRVIDNYTDVRLRRWLRDQYLWLRDQYQWHMVMGPSLLTAEQETEMAAKPGSDFRECANACPTMIVVPGGGFMMGSPESEIGRSNNEGPQHEVKIARSFAVSKTEVTFAQWDACRAATACTKASDSNWGRDDRPVVSVSWDDAKEYAAWLSRITGKDYRLLTEAEWEYAARAGSSARFAFGDSEEQLDQYAWYDKNSGAKTQPVAKKNANAFGLHDMHGNAYEWVEDPWHDDYVGAPADGSAWLKNGDGTRRVLRGGSWYNHARFLRAAFRYGDTTVLRFNFIGFRLARNLNH
jgi:formylglycine-generating enzyme required for sulfatase activity